MWSLKGLPVLVIVCFIALIAVKNAEACSCFPTHPQTHFCTSHFVIAIKVKERMQVEHEMVYKVKINKKFKLSNESFNELLDGGHLFTANLDSVCGVQLDVGETYVVSGRVYEGKPRISLCNLIMRASEVTKRQRKGFKGLYAKGCMCEVSYTAFQRKGEALHRAKGKLCPWEASPGPLDCQDKHGVCVSNQGRCFWMPSRPYNDCIREHYQTRLSHQRPPREIP